MIVTAHDTFVRSEDVLTRSVEDSVLLLRPDGSGRVVSLSGSGPEIWRLLSQPLSVEELVARLAERFGVPTSSIDGDVRRTLTALVEANVIVRRVA